MGGRDTRTLRAGLSPGGAVSSHGDYDKRCSKCGMECQVEDIPHFFHSNGKGGFHASCKDCRNTADPRTKQSHADPRRAERLASDYAALKPEDYDVTVANDGRIDPKAAAEKRQEYSKSMGEFARDLAAGELTDRDGHYIGALAEQERRFQNRRTARTISLTAANEALHLRQFKAAAEEYLSGKVEPTGWALEGALPTERTVILFLSDLHIGAELSELDNPVPFRAVQEARRLEHIIRQAIDYKPQYRAESELLLILGGDMIEGLLLHDLRDGAPLTEQMVAFWRYMSVAMGVLAANFPAVRVVCQSGNHGRNLLRHPGRATSSKWDGIEFQLYYGLQMMCRDLKNVTWDLSFRALSVVNLHGSTMAVTHGDTELKLGHPDKAAEKNASALAQVNSSRLYGCEFDVVAFGHFHTPRFQPGRPTIISNGMLVPPNGHARTQGYVNERCGQWIWEAVPGFPVGDLRYITVGEEQDQDERLGKLIQPFRFT